MKPQTPIVKVGTELSCGTVVAIKQNGVDIKTPEGVKKFSFIQVERFVNDHRFVSQA